jgi:hypothetical protein
MAFGNQWILELDNGGLNVSVQVYVQSRVDYCDKQKGDYGAIWNMG